MATTDKATSRVEAKPSLIKQNTKKMTSSSNGKHSNGSNFTPKIALGDEKLTGTSGRVSSRGFAIPKSLKNLKADLMASTTSKSSPIPSSDTNADPDSDHIPVDTNRNENIFPSHERLQSSQFAERRPLNEQEDHQQKEEELRRNSNGPLHRPHKQQRSISPISRSKSSNRDEQERHVAAENDSSLTSSRNTLPPLWTDGFAKGVTKSVQRSVQDIISRGNLLHAPKRNFLSSLSPENILKPSSQRLGSEEEEDEYILGSGSFSKVTKVHIKEKDGSLFALKRLKGDLLPSKLTEKSCKNGSVIAFTKAATELAREAFLLSRFDHPHIINILGWTDGGVTSYSVYRRHDAYFLVLELLQEETLNDRIEGWNQDDDYLRSILCTEDKLKVHFHRRKMEQLTICRQVASALAYIHLKNVVYRDLKPQNIGFAREIDNEGYACKGNVVVKLMDFGLARELPSGGVIRSYSAFQEHSSSPLFFDMTGTVGTIRYMAPEVCMNQPYGLECDIYSWSIVAHQILSQTKPFDDMTPDMYQSLVCQRGVRPPTQNIPSDYIVLLTQAWRTNPFKRLPFNRIKHQLDLFLQQEKLIWEAQELLSVMPEKSEPPIFLSKSFAEENFEVRDSSYYQRDSRRPNKRSWHRTFDLDDFPGRDLRKNAIFPNASMEYQGEHQTTIEYNHPHDYNYSHNKSRRDSPMYEVSPPVQSHYEANGMSHPRRKPEPVTPDRHSNLQKQRHRLPHERASRTYYNNHYNSSNCGGNGYHEYNYYDNYHHYGNYSGSVSRHRQISPSNDHGHWGDAYY